MAQLQGDVTEDGAVGRLGWDGGGGALARGARRADCPMCLIEGHTARRGGRLITRITIDDSKRRRHDMRSAEGRAAFDRTYETTLLAIDVGEKLRAAREAAVARQSHGTTWAG